jgi:hypothetical protein
MRWSIPTGVASCSSRIRRVFRIATAGGRLLCASRGSFPFIEKFFTDSGYAGQKIAEATVIAVEIVHKDPDQVGCRPAAPLGRRTLLCLDQPQPPSRKGL